MNTRLWWMLLTCTLCTGASTMPAREPVAPPLPEQTSRYNHGGHPGRYRDHAGDLRRFALKAGKAMIYDGGGRAIAAVTEPVLLNVGGFKDMSVAGSTRSFGWAWNTPAGSGWIALDDLKDPPVVEIDPHRDPAPPRESDRPLTIDCARGRTLLAGLRHVDSKGRLPVGGANKGEHYAGRHPGPHDYVYLLFECPNVRHGGVAKDSLLNGGQFIPALDADGKPIAETMTMYRDNDPKQPVRVTFIYGRAKDGKIWGWLARANVGAR